MKYLRYGGLVLKKLLENKWKEQYQWVHSIFLFFIVAGAFYIGIKNEFFECLFLAAVLMIELKTYRMIKNKERQLDKYKEMEEKIRSSEKRFRERLNRISSGIVMLRPSEDGKDFIVTDFSKGQKINELLFKNIAIGKKVTDIYPGVKEMKILELLQNVWETGEAEYIEASVERENELEQWRTLHIYKMEWDELFVVFDDITKQKIIEESLRDAMEYQNLRTEFFTNMSHEFKTPINLILSSLQLLELYDEQKEEFLTPKIWYKQKEVIKQNGYRLLRLINNLIDIKKVDMGYLEPQMKNYNIVYIIEEITLSVAEYAKKNQIELLFDTDVEEKSTFCDYDMIERIMLNLLSNAVKFTPRGGTIFVNIWDKIDTVQISVKDTGIGIPKESKEIIFDRFGQVDRSLTRKREGSGIGLALVKSLVEIHGGTIEVYSEVGEGTEFIIELPIADDVAAMHQKREEYIDGDRIEKISIEFSDIYSDEEVG